MSETGGNREEMLADFQACTGIENVEEAILYLEDSDWNLLAAINRVLPQDIQSLPSENSAFNIPNNTPARSHFPMDQVSTVKVDVPDFGIAASSNHIKKETTTDERITLHIQDETGKEIYDITFPGTKTIRGVKDEIYSITDIPVRMQIWTGWPDGVVDTFTLNSCGLNNPHSLSVRKSLPTDDLNKKLEATFQKMADNDAGSETSSDVEDLTESYPLEEDYFVPEENKQQKFLIADNISDEITGTIQFSENFASRYGSCHPMFFHGTLEEATREACHKSAKDRKMFAIYLHHDGSVTSNVFCQQILCNESIVSYITNNFVIWGWDVTNESNRQLLLAAVSKNFGPPGVATVRGLDRDRYPVIILVSRTRSATEICSVVSSTTTVDDLMSSLLQSVDIFHSQQLFDIREEEEREARERVKREQDEAYQASLRADKAKDQARRVLEQQKILEDIERQNQEKKVEEERARVARSLPPEPAVDCIAPIITLKCRLPGGKSLSRKFLRSTETLQVLFDFLFSKGFPKEQYKFLTSYPKRDITTLASTTGMADLFSAQDTLIVEER